MDIEELSKAQLLLLTVMVNFVVSIATGVLTVSLLDQAPIQVTEGVDRVVERTIETIATPVQVVNPIKSITSAVKPPEPAPSTEEQLTAAVGEVASRTALIHKNSTSSPAIAFGTYVPESRAVVTASVQGLPKEALISFSDGSAYKASISRTSGALTIYGFADAAALPESPDAALTAHTSLKQGQSAITLTKDSAAVSGIISKVASEGIETSLTNVPVGGGVVSLDGSVIGIGSLTPGVLVPADAVTALLGSAPTKK